MNERNGQNVIITMIDTKTQKIEVREIDISNFYRNERYVANQGDQRAIVEDWIIERGNPQHDTILKLVSWGTD